MDAAEIPWVGTGWRYWRVAVTEDGPRLRNPLCSVPFPSEAESLRDADGRPLTDRGRMTVWGPGQVVRAGCHWLHRCPGGARAGCSCGLRSMATLIELLTYQRAYRATWPWMEVVGRVEIDGAVHRRTLNLTPWPGYQRSEFGRVAGPLFVAPWAAGHVEGLQGAYGPSVDVYPPLPGHAVASMPQANANSGGCTLS